MGTPYMGEIKIVAFNFAPQGWAMANGQLLPINQNQALFSLFGTTYGGNGQTNFAIPDMRGRIPNHFGSGLDLGERGGEAAHTLTSSEMPQHNHFITASTRVPVVDDPNSTPDPTGAYFGRTSHPGYHAPSGGLTTLSPFSLGSIGGSQPHNNMAPYLVLTFIVALQGAFPSQN